MGAVFALFAAYYYWSPKILGKTYNELLGHIHFWTMFIGVNLTFSIRREQITKKLLEKFYYILEKIT
jgi:heme/copper-type cytochrome/quinol oxidase subunit 1